MINKNKIEDLSINFRRLLISSPAADIDKNFRALLESAFTKLELVSREEFDVQSDVLRHTRQKLVQLEEKLNQLEAVLQKDNIKV
jgi:ubiquinone biosynthesis accessory factor UbiK